VTTTRLANLRPASACWAFSESSTDANSTKICNTKHHRYNQAKHRLGVQWPAAKHVLFSSVIFRKFWWFWTEVSIKHCLWIQRTVSLFHILHIRILMSCYVLLVGLTVFHEKFCQIPRSSSQNSAAHCVKIVQFPRLTAAFHLCIN